MDKTDEDPILEMLYQTQTDLIQTYAETHHRLAAIGVAEEFLVRTHDEYEMVMGKINKAIERQKLINRMK